MAIAPSETAPAQAHVTPVTPVEDELDKYLALPAVEDPGADVLAWWRDQDCKAGLPNVAQLARQQAPWHSCVFGWRGAPLQPRWAHA